MLQCGHLNFYTVFTGYLHTLKKLLSFYEKRNRIKFCSVDTWDSIESLKLNKTLSVMLRKIFEALARSGAGVLLGALDKIFSENQWRFYGAGVWQYRKIYHESTGDCPASSAPDKKIKHTGDYLAAKPENSSAGAGAGI